MESNMKNITRSEQEVFTDLESLCQRSGYVHVLAHICFRDNMISYADRMTEDDMGGMYSARRIIRTEINTLIGLMIKAEIDWTIPAAEVQQEYLEATERLLEELHWCLSSAAFAGLSKESIEDGSFDPFNRGEALREPIFYSGDSAHSFQYLDLALKKYANDNPWLEPNVGFTIQQACEIAKCIGMVHEDRFRLGRKQMRAQSPSTWTMAPCFGFSVTEVAAKSGIAADVIEKVLTALTVPSAECNAAFNALSDFNTVSARPLLRMPNGDFLSLQAYAISEALYESPFYWMAQDKPYLPTLSKHRGDFTESFVVERLALVFGAENVYSNVDIYQNKSRVSDIDALVVWGNRLLIVQAKSKRLSFEARKGNDQVLRDDFKKAVQAAYDQAITCAKCLLGTGYRFSAPSGRDVSLPDDIKTIYIFCVVSDHYPALSFQARKFLKTEKVDRVQAPMVMDVFAIDEMTEMLQTPLQFISYINARAIHAEKLLAMQEQAILGFHLKENLWLDPKYDKVHIDDNYATGVDVAMAVRRTGIPGSRTPEGILTRLPRTVLGRVLAQIEKQPEPMLIDLGLLLLSLNGDTVKQISNAIEKLAALTRSDGKLHDATCGVRGEAGITFHCTGEPPAVARQRLKLHCEISKYREQATEWFGICINPDRLDIRFALALAFAWEQDPAMDHAVEAMQASMSLAKSASKLQQFSNNEMKIGRNNPCPCGSGNKYKKCCL